MQITILYFAQARDHSGCAKETIELPDGSRVAEAIVAIKRDHPKLEALWPHLAIAVDGALVDENATLAAGAEMALLPPVSGG